MSKNPPLRWSEPPEGPTRYDWSAIADQLRQNKNEWACIFEQDRASVVHAIRMGAISALRPVWSTRPDDVTTAGFEITTRNNTRGTPRKCDLYLRYVPAKRKRKR